MEEISVEEEEEYSKPNMCRRHVPKNLQFLFTTKL